MLVTRKIGKLIRGKATPFQIVSASILGTLLGFTPGFQQAPGLILLYVSCLIALNANLFLAGLAGLLGKLLLLALMPVAFAIGRFLLEGPANALFAALANGPITAYFGLDYYVVPGGQLLGLIIGSAIGIALTRALSAYRRRMQRLESDSDKMRRWSSKGWVKALTFVFLGSGKGKKSYEELLSKRWGNPIRIPGAAAIAILAVIGYLAARSLSDPIVTAAIKSGLEKANGATVDLANAHLDLDEGKIELDGLALADPENLDTNLFASDRIVADISAADILRKRFSIDSLVFENASSGMARAQTGSRVGPDPKQSAVQSIELPDYQDIASFIEDAPEWRERLGQLRKWLDALGSSDSGSTDLKQSLASRIQSLGYTRVAKKDLIRGSPMIWIRNLVATEVRTNYLDRATLAISADNLSSHPNLVDSDPIVKVESSNGELKAELTLGAAAGRADNRIDLRMRNISVDEFAAKLKNDGGAPISGGTMDLNVTGTLSSIDSDLTISPVFSGSKIAIGGSSVSADNLSIPISIRGPIDNPRVKLDSKAVTNALANAGKQELLNRAAEKLGIDTSDTSDSGDLEGAAKKILGGFLNKKEDGE